MSEKTRTKGLYFLPHTVLLYSKRKKKRETERDMKRRKRRKRKGRTRKGGATVQCRLTISRAWMTSGIIES